MTIQALLFTLAAKGVRKITFKNLCILSFALLVYSWFEKGKDSHEQLDTDRALSFLEDVVDTLTLKRVGLLVGFGFVIYLFVKRRK